MRIENMSAKAVLKRIIAQRELEHEANIRELKDYWRDREPAPVRDDKHSTREGRAQQFEDLYRQGLSDNEIAERMGTAATNVSKRRNDLGLPPNHTAVMNERNARIKALIVEGKTNKEISAAIAGLTPNAINHIRDRIRKGGR